MDTINSYLKNLLVSQDLLPEQESALQAHKKEVTDFLLAEFSDKKPIIKYAGSREKGTMIRDNYDLDIVCYFPSTDTRTLKEIRDDVSDHLGKKYMMQDKASAERILNLKHSTAPHSYHIDVVPGRFIEDSNDVFLYLAQGDKERLQTNLKTHIDHIVNSECVSVIRLAKIWTHRNNVDVKTFVLEIFVVDALSGSHNKENLQVSFLKVLEELKNRFSTAQLIDPANTNNIVSKLVDSSSKVMVVHAAETAFNKINGSTDLADWQSIFCDTDGGRAVPSSTPAMTSPSSSSKGFTPQAPWCSDYADDRR